ncbi:hypothetical protein [Microbulbifer epialgicus]|uniref:Lysine-specific metallo-endopeptidase domain-containing protein n=1 Tax=Microbulbifer epialgicus TaxID=393907 RepID=A0ABV4P272_9GAMM
MTNLVSRSIRYGVDFNVLVNDSVLPQFKTKVKTSCGSWLDDAQEILDLAIQTCTTALVTPDNVSDRFHNLISYYFGLPSGCSRERYRACLNAILSRLNRTKSGLSNGVDLADREQMPYLAKASTYVSWAFCQGDPTERMAGFVWQDFLESVPNYAKKAYKIRKTKWDQKNGWISTFLGGQLNGGGFEKPLYYPIHLNFNKIWPKGRAYCIVTLIHEATHKFAETVDHEYFKDDGSILAKLDQAIRDCSVWKDIYLNGDLKNDEDREAKACARVAEQALKQLRGENPAAKTMQQIGEMEAVNNADSLAWFAHDVALLSLEIT